MTSTVLDEIGESARATNADRFTLFPRTGGELCFVEPIEVVAAWEIGEVACSLRRIDRYVDAGRWAAGFVSYEAAPAFDPAFVVHGGGGLPLLWFGIYEGLGRAPLPVSCDCGNAPDWAAGLLRAKYEEALARIRAYIEVGDTYQVNFTFPLEAAFRGDAQALFRKMCDAQRAEYCAYVDAGRFKVLSVSPELFFRLDRDRLVTRPMKGTAPRGLWTQSDVEEARRLAESPKDRAENVMIADLLRNDLGRISETGSVVVEKLFEVERYETLWQMTSTIASRTRATVPEILGALFPSGSVTGAPKIRTMEIIHELEAGPRGVYCGAVGWWGPNRQAEFNVAIRTLTVDTERERAVYHIGSGITWDSLPEAEYDECLLKARVLTHRRPEFSLLETLLWDGEWFLLEEHLVRLRGSADYFGYRYDESEMRQRIRDLEPVLQKAAKVRVLLEADGSIRIEHAPATPPEPMTIALAAESVDESDVFLYHKTTRRETYERIKAQHPDCDDVLLWNSRGEITESTIANVVVEVGGRRVTPPVACGLLPGVMRAHLLERGEILEGVVTKDMTRRAESVYLINSVRKWIPVRLQAAD